MNVLLLTTHLNIGGIACYVVNLAKELKKKGHRVMVSSSGGIMARELVREGILHINLKIRTKSELSPKLLLAIPRLLSVIRDNDIQIIHAHTRVTQVLACIVSRLSGLSYVSTCHGFFKSRLGRRLFRCWGDRTIAVSDAVRDHLLNDFNVAPDDIALIFNGVDVKRFKKQFNQSQRDSLRRTLRLKDEIVIGAIGRLSPVKGYGYLIEAFKSLLDRYKNLRLLIVGGGPEKNRLRELCKKLGVDEYVIFTESRLDIPELLSVMDIFVSSSVQEGLGLSLAEALASGRAVVASDVGGASSLIKNGQTGLLMKSKDVKVLTQAITLLLKDPDLRSRLGREGRRLVEKDFTIEVMTDKVEAVYRDAIETRKAESSDMGRILIVNVNWLGDVLFTTPFIKAIRRRFPSSHIACLVVPRCGELLEDNPSLDEIITYAQDGEHKSIFGKIKLIKLLRKKRFDGAFILHRSFTRALMVYLSGIRVRVGYDTKNRTCLLNQPIEENILDLHKVEYFLNIARACGADTSDKDYEFFVKKDEREEIEKFLIDKGVDEKDRLVVLNPGGNWPPKRWPKRNFAELSDRLSDKLNAKVVITGAAKDSRLAQDILNLSKSKPIDASGATSLKRLAALMERADLVISSDSGPMHLALSVKSKVIALFGPTSDLITGPYGSGEFAVIKKDVNCPVPCYNFSCRDYRCMKAITVDEVFEKAKEMLKEIKN